MIDKNIKEAFNIFLEKHFGGTTQEVAETVEHTRVLNKAVDEEQRKALFVVLAPEEEDLHGDIYDSISVENACHNYNTHCAKANLFHEVQDIKDAFPVESYILPVELSLDDGRTITKGTWVQLWTFEETPAGELLWASVKSGDITGVSIGCLVSIEELEQESADD